MSWSLIIYQLRPYVVVSQTVSYNLWLKIGVFNVRLAKAGAVRFS